MPNPATVRETIRQIRSLLLDLLGEQPAASSRITAVLKVLEDLERQVDGLAGEAERRFRGKTKTYGVETRGPEEVLAEYRPDDEIPFRCPQVTYDALARVLAKTDGFVKYEELMNSLGKEMKKRPADYQVRLALRFWAQPGVGLIERARARYRPKKKTGFLEAARRVWREATA